METIIYSDESRNSLRSFENSELILQALKAEYKIKSCEVGLTFVDLSEMEEINSKFRAILAPTDVLAFPRRSWSPPLPQSQIDFEEKNPNPLNRWLGDIVICPQYAEKEALSRHLCLDSEVKMLIVHGFLHLCGHDHQLEGDKVLMFSEQERLLNKVASIPLPGCILDYFDKPPPGCPDPSIDRSQNLV